MLRIDISEEDIGKRTMLLGNQAIARGAIEAGVKVATSYPGTPSTEVMETLTLVAKKLGIYAEWSVNEKVALEVAIGASYSGVRAITSMKHVGVNVCLDPLITLAYTGVRGGLVLVSADDPSCYSSQNEQDNRFLARFANIFCFEPYDPQSAKDYTKKAFEVSEEFEIPVMIRTTTRVSHANGDVKLDSILKTNNRCVFEKDPRRFVCVPKYSRDLHIELNKKLKRMEEFSDRSEFNYMKIDGDIGIITSGVSRNYVKEALKSFNIDASVLELGITHPLPKKIIGKFLSKVDKVLVIEELEPFVEDYIKSLSDIEIHGKDYVPREFELNVDIVKKSISEFLNLEFKEIHRDCGIELLDRPPVLCAGCPHRAVFYALNKIKKKKIFAGDIGCYTLGFDKPLKAIDTVLCMGASITIGSGIFDAGVKDSIVAIIGDSTFLHAGIPGLLNSVYNKSDITVIILDNETTAMTGHQPHPAIGITAIGEKTKKVNFEEIAKACKAEFVRKIKPFDIEESIKILENAINFKGVSVVISEEPCTLIAKKRGLWKNHLQVNEDKCDGCRACINQLGCPALYWKDGKINIMETLCNGCSICMHVCSNNAFEEVKNED